MPDFFKELIHEKDLQINITSMIDVIFILLIFFMIGSQFKKNSLILNLPQTEATDVKETNPIHVLSIGLDKMELDGMAVDLETLTPHLTKQFSENPDYQIKLECDRDIKFERFVQILSKIQNAGITKIAIEHETLDN